MSKAMVDAGCLPPLYEEIRRLEYENTQMREALQTIGVMDNCGLTLSGGYRQCLNDKCCVCCWETAQLAVETLALHPLTASMKFGGVE